MLGPAAASGKREDRREGQYLRRQLARPRPAVAPPPGSGHRVVLGMESHRRPVWELSIAESSASFIDRERRSSGAREPPPGPAHGEADYY